LASETTLQLTLWLLIRVAACLAVHCLLGSARSRSALPLLALAGGVIALPIEPFWDVNVLFTFASNSWPIAFTAFGRSIPLYLAFIYPAFIGWGSYVGYLLIRRGTRTRTLLVLPAAFFLADAIIEILGGHLNLWTYYGEQTFTVAQWPVIFGLMNGTITLFGGALLYVLDRRLSGLSRIALAFAVPSAYVGIYAIAGWPTWAALNADVPPLINWLACALSITICASAAYLVADGVSRYARSQSHLLPSARPLDSDQTALRAGLAVLGRE
jgi:hypothetical protein